MSDQVIRFSGTKTKKHYPDTTRRIVYYNKDGNRTFVFYTNAFLLTAEMVALLYKYRWRVELFFKWMKQHLRIKEFFLDDTIENRAHRNMIFEDLQKAAQAVLLSAKSPKDMEIYGNLKIQVWKVKRLDKEDPVKREQPKNKPIKVYTTDPNMIGIPSIDRNLLAQQIDSIPDISERDRERLKRDAGIIETTFEEMLDDTQEKTQDYG